MSMGLAWRRVVVGAVALVVQATSSKAEILNLTTSSERVLGSTSSGQSTNVSDETVEMGTKTFTVRFGLNVNADAGEFGLLLETGLGKYTANFTVRSSGNYDMTIGTARRGALRRVPDSIFGCSGSVSVGAVEAPVMTINTNEPGPSLSELGLPGAEIEDGGGNTGTFAEDVTRSVTLPFRNRPTQDTFSLVAFMNGTALSNSCEVSARVGAQNGSTAGCDDICGYPGDFGSRNINDDGLFVKVTVVDFCGNGGTDPGEQCDLGELNGTPGSCCTATCQFRPQNQICRPSAGDCDLSEFCTGTSPTCPFDAKLPSSEVCRPPAGICDVLEKCTGSTNDCPADSTRTGAVCRPADPAANGCDVAEICQGGVICPPDGKQAPGTSCDSDFNTCTDDQCDAGGQCTHIPVTPAGKVCDDSVFCNGEDRCGAAGVCEVHTQARCTGTQTCDELGKMCLTPPILVTNADDGGTGSLRAAIGLANITGGADTISFDPDFFRVPRTINLEGSLTPINEDLSINGPGANLLTVAGDNQSRVFTIEDGATVSLNGLTITGGNAGAGRGGGILNRGRLTVNNCRITGNTATVGGGIGDESSGALILRASTVSNNIATDRLVVSGGFGGGISLFDSVGTFTDCTFSGNTSMSTGGAVDLQDASGSFTNCTISDNTATGFGGGGGISLLSLLSDQMLAVTNSTIVNNTGSNAGGIRVEAFPDLTAAVALRNSIIANNKGGPNLNRIQAFIVIESLGFNLTNDDGGGFLDHSTDQLNKDPMLGPLQNNGGPTQTHALLPGSPAIDKGSSSGSSTDQRGFPRPIDAPAIANDDNGDGADIGAFELSLHVCTGDCDGGGRVTVDELVRGVNIALANASVDDCPAFDTDSSHTVTVDELVLAVNAALNGC